MNLQETLTLIMISTVFGLVMSGVQLLVSLLWGYVKSIFFVTYLYNGSKLNQIDGVDKGFNLGYHVNNFLVTNANTLSSTWNPGIKPAIQYNGDDTELKFGYLNDFGSIYFYYMMYSITHDVYCINILFSSPGRSAVAKFIEGYRIQAQRNLLDDHITPEKTVFNKGGFRKEGRVDFMDDNSIIGNDHKDVLQVLEKFIDPSYSTNIIAIGLPLRLCIHVHSPTTVSKKSIVDMCSNITGLDLREITDLQNSIGEDSTDPVNWDIENIFPTDNNVTVYSVEALESIATMINGSDTLSIIDTLTLENIVDHLVDCSNPNNCVIVIYHNVASAADPSIDQLKKNAALDYSFEIKDIVGNNISALNLIAPESTRYSVNLTPESADETFIVDYVERFFKSIVPGYNTFVADNMAEYTEMLTNVGAGAYVQTELRNVILQTIRYWMLKEDVVSLKEVVQRCKHFSFSPEQKFFILH